MDRKKKGFALIKLLVPITIIAILAAMRSPLAAAPIVTNNDFAVESPGNERLPAGWNVPPDSPWYRTNEDGHSGNTSIRYSTDARASAGPVTQSILLEGDTAYVLSCAIKSDASLKPVVRLKYSGKDGAELVGIVGDDSSGLWRSYLYKFKTGIGGEVIVELWADTTQSQREPGWTNPPGTIAIDDVQVVRTDQAETLPSDSSHAVSYENLARGKHYTLNPAPNYDLCTDPGDITQLTDGQYTIGYFWAQKTTVGWVGVPNATITIDLGDDYPIRGISFNTAGSTAAGVLMPSAIRVFVSVDGRAFHEAGDLVKLSERCNPVELSKKRNPAPGYGGYFNHCYHTDELQVHGRYVRLEIDITPPFCFVDEIEVYRGEDKWKELPLLGEAVIRLREHFGQDLFNTNLSRRIETDLDEVRAELGKRKLPANLQNRLDEEIKRLDQAVLRLPDVDPKNFRGVFPLNSVHADIYAVLGALRTADGHPPVVIWRANPWDYLTPMELPENNSSAEILVAAMKGETRAAAVNLTNCTERPLTAQLTFENLPGGSNPGYVSVHNVAWTDTKEGIAVAAALLEAPRTERGYTVSLPAGMTCQVWFSFTPQGIAAGTHHGYLVVSGATDSPLRVPVTLRVFDINFPARPRLHVGGFDYTNTTNGETPTPQNRELVAYLQSRFVDSPSATNWAMPEGEFDSSGRFLKEPDTANFDAWVARWPDARRYDIFNNRSDIAGTKIDEPLFAQKVATWINFWVKHAKSRGIPPDRLFFLLLDESQSLETDRIIIAWSRAIKAAQPEVIIWDDGTRPDERNTPELMAAVDFLCPHRPSILDGSAKIDFYLKYRKAGGQLDLYSCLGPAKLLDPYTYYRLQAWSCFQLGAEGTFFWSFSTFGRDNTWNEYVPASMNYAPFFLDANSVTPGKQMEAIREGVEDYEYLVMLKDAIAKAEKRGVKSKALDLAKGLLSEGVNSVLNAPGANEFKWMVEKDRSVVDQVRIKILEMLTDLQG